MKRRFWRAVAHYSCKRAGLRAVAAVHVGDKAVWTATPMTTGVAYPIQVRWTSSAPQL